MITKAQYRGSLKAHLTSHQLLIRSIPKELAIVITQALAAAHTLPAGLKVSDYAAHATTIPNSVAAITNAIRAHLDLVDTQSAKIAADLKVRADSALSDHGDFDV